MGISEPYIEIRSEKQIMPDENGIEQLLVEPVETTASEEPTGVVEQTSAERMYPVATSLFQVSVKPLQQIKDHCYVFLDANVLLQPYQSNTKGREEIKKAYDNLSNQNRLYVPGQVAREFAKNRTNLLKELHQQLRVSKDQVPQRPNLKKLERFDREILKWLGEKYDIEAKIVAVNKAIDEYNLEFDKVQSLISSWKEDIGKIMSDFKNFRWNDPVTNMYACITPEMVVEPTTSREDINNDFIHRNQHKLPPGFGDAGKNKVHSPYEGMGDLLIWYSMLDKAVADKKDVIFVSNDANKGDWWVVNDKMPLFPRFELVDEFYRKTRGCSFHILSFSDFLKLYEVSEEVVMEVRKEEAEQELINVPTLKQVLRSTAYKIVASSAVEVWLLEHYHTVYEPADDVYDYIVLPVEGATERYGVNVKVYQVSQSGGLRISVFMNNIIQEMNDLWDIATGQNLAGHLLIVVFPNANTAELVNQNFKMLNKPSPSLTVSVGFYDNDQYHEIALLP